MIFARPLTWSEWILWVCANEPARVWTEEERAAWIAAHPAELRRFWSKRDSYGLAGSGRA